MNLQDHACRPENDARSLLHKAASLGKDFHSTFFTESGKEGDDILPAETHDKFIAQVKELRTLCNRYISSAVQCRESHARKPKKPPVVNILDGFLHNIAFADVALTDDAINYQVDQLLMSDCFDPKKQMDAESLAWLHGSSCFGVHFCFLFLGIMPYYTQECLNSSLSFRDKPIQNWGGTFFLR